MLQQQHWQQLHSSYNHSVAHWYQLPKNQPTRILLAKTEPPWLGCWFFGSNHPPLKLHLPATSHLMYPTPIGSSLPKNQPTQISLAKTELPQLGFCFFGLTTPPHAPLNCNPLPHQIQHSPLLLGPLYPKPSQLTIFWLKPSPHCSVFGFFPTTNLLPPPPHASPIRIPRAHKCDQANAHE